MRRRRRRLRSSCTSSTPTTSRCGPTTTIRRRRPRSGSQGRRSSTPARCSCRSIPYVGAGDSRGGALLAENERPRAAFGRRTRGSASTRSAQLELLPQTENVFTVFKDGWHPAEVAAAGRRASSGSGRRRRRPLAFRIPRGRVALPRRPTTPARSCQAAAAGRSAACGDQAVDVVHRRADEPPLRKIRSAGRAARATDDMAELRIDGRQDVRAGPGQRRREQGPARTRRPRLPRVRRAAGEPCSRPARWSVATSPASRHLAGWSSCWRRCWPPTSAARASS